MPEVKFGGPTSKQRPRCPGCQVREDDRHLRASVLAGECPPGVFKGVDDYWDKIRRIRESRA